MQPRGRARGRRAHGRAAGALTCTLNLSEPGPTSCSSKGVGVIVPFAVKSRAEIERSAMPFTSATSKSIAVAGTPETSMSYGALKAKSVLAKVLRECFPSFGPDWPILSPAALRSTMLDMAMVTLSASSSESGPRTIFPDCPRTRTEMPVESSRSSFWLPLPDGLPPPLSDGFPPLPSGGPPPLPSGGPAAAVSTAARQRSAANADDAIRSAAGRQSTLTRRCVRAGRLGLRSCATVHPAAARARRLAFRVTSTQQ